MRRRGVISACALAPLAAALVACQSSAQQNNGNPGETAGGPGSAGNSGAGQPGDVKKVAASLQAKTQGLIDAIAAKNDDNTRKAKTDLNQELNKAEDVIKSQTGQAANQVNSAIAQIRQGIISNDVPKLEKGKQLLQQAQQ